MVIQKSVSLIVTYTDLNWHQGWIQMQFCQWDPQRMLLRVKRQDQCPFSCFLRKLAQRTEHEEHQQTLPWLTWPLLRKWALWQASSPNRCRYFGVSSGTSFCFQALLFSSHQYCLLSVTDNYIWINWHVIDFCTMCKGGWISKSIPLFLKSPRMGSITLNIFSLGG